MTGIMNYIKISSPWYIVLTSGYTESQMIAFRKWLPWYIVLTSGYAQKASRKKNGF